VIVLLQCILIKEYRFDFEYESSGVKTLKPGREPALLYRVVKYREDNAYAGCAIAASYEM